jgi:hypothetical protein
MAEEYFDILDEQGKLTGEKGAAEWSKQRNTVLIDASRSIPEVVDEILSYIKG